MNCVRQTALCAFASLISAAAMAAPIGYSINSDQPDGDNLYAIDLATGSATLRGKVMSLGATRTDVEGLAFAPDGRLWGVDEDSLTLFPVSTVTGVVDHLSEVPLQGLTPPGNDFGLAFTCTGELLATSVRTQSLYRLSLGGTATMVGAAGALGANISALAAWGEPVQLFGLGNGLLEGGGVDSRRLYSIDPDTGVATEIGQVGGGVADYNQAGLSFDDVGQLWAITDRRNVGGMDFGSQVIRLNTATGAGTVVSSTTQVGFESLAVAPPGGCAGGPPPLPSEFAKGLPADAPWAVVLAVLALLLTGLAALRTRA